MSQNGSHFQMDRRIDKIDGTKEKYTCDACRYTFESDKLPDRCPDCGKERVRSAGESEIYDYDHRFDNGEGVRTYSWTVLCC